MSEALKDPFWQFAILAGLTIATIIVAIVIYFKQKQKKRLSYQVLLNSRLLSVKEEIKGDIEILYKGTQVKQVNVITLKIAHPGSAPIRKEDFEKPLLFSFGRETKILTAEVIKTNPPNLAPQIQFDQEKVTFSPLLLNPSDYVIIKILVTNFEYEIIAESRIVGVKKVEEGIDKSSINQRVFGVGLVCEFLALAIFIISGVFQPSIFLSLLPAIILAIIGAITMFYGITKDEIFKEIIEN